MRSHASFCIVLALATAAGAQEPQPPRDTRGIGAFHEGPGRSPAGFMYDPPFAPATPAASESGWTYHGGLDLGVIGGDGDLGNTIFREYRDSRNGFLLQGFGLTAERDKDARYLHLFGGKAGNDDQSFGLEVVQPLGRFVGARVIGHAAQFVSGQR